MRFRALMRLGAARGKPLGLLIMVVLAACLAFTETRPQLALRDGLFDAYQRSFVRTRINDGVVIIQIDDRSLAEYGQWPWPRSLVADLIGRLAAAEPAAIAIDAEFPEADRLSPGTLARWLAQDGYADAARAVAKLPDNDERLAAALQGAPVVLGVAALGEPNSGAQGPEFHAPVQQTGGDAAAFVRRYPASLRSLESIDRSAIGHGVMNSAGLDSVARRVPALVAIGNTLLPGLALETLRVAVGAPPLRVWVDARGVSRVAAGDYEIPTDPNGEWWLHFSDPAERPHVSAASILRGEVAAADLAGRIALLGYTAMGLKDVVATPLGHMPGVEVHAEAIDNALDGRLLQRPWWAHWLEAALLILLSVLAIIGVPRWRPRVALAAGVGAVAVIMGCGAAAFLQWGWLIDSASPVAGGALVLAVMLSTSLTQAESQKRRLQYALAATREKQLRMEGELDAARRIQMGMLPVAADALRGEMRVQVGALMLPARTVGGDLYDFFMLDAARLFFLVGDVSGKGLPASLFMSLSKAMIKSAAAACGGDPGATLTQAGAALAQQNPEQLFVTVLAASLHLETGELHWCSAGHESPWLLAAGGAEPVRLSGTGGPPLCVIDGYAFHAERLQLQAGDTLALLTDGVGEAQNPDGELFGAARLEACIRRAAVAGDAQAVVDAIGQHVTAFTAGAELADDVTALVLRLNAR